MEHCKIIMRPNIILPQFLDFSNGFPTLVPLVH